MMCTVCHFLFSRSHNNSTCSYGNMTRRNTTDLQKNRTLQMHLNIHMEHRQALMKFSVLRGFLFCKNLTLVTVGYLAIILRYINWWSHVTSDDIRHGNCQRWMSKVRNAAAVTLQELLQQKEFLNEMSKFTENWDRITGIWPGFPPGPSFSVVVENPFGLLSRFPYKRHEQMNISFLNCFLPLIQ
jgi:hypothetical protein